MFRPVPTPAAPGGPDPTTRRPRQGPTVRSRAAALAAAAGLTLAGCAGAGAVTGGGDTEQIVVAIVSNPQMQDAISLQDQFRAEHPGIDVQFVSLPENEARAKITASVATGGGEFDVVMISNYETAMWAENGWIRSEERRVGKVWGGDMRRRSDRASSGSE